MHFAPAALHRLRAALRARPMARDAALLALAGGGLVAGIALAVSGLARAADVAWGAVAAGALLLAGAGIARDLLRRRAGVDLIALLALAGALALGETLAGAVIGVMLATGVALERYAASRAERELSALLARAPRLAHRLVDGALETIPVDAVRRGDRLLVKVADVIPVDGVIVAGPVVLDESALTGESRLVDRDAGDEVRSGALNAGAAFELRATAPAAESAYAGIIRLVEHAQETKAPFVRLADRYAAIFVPVTLAVAGAAWALTGDPVRALAVLVVATPCPLLLAAPIAIVAGISRAARRGIIVKDGGALETLARATALFFDKTGTLTMGTPQLQDVVTVAPWTDGDELLRLAASVDQLSSHVLALALVRGARDRGLALSLPAASDEAAGDGIAGTVDGRRVLAGSVRWVTATAGTPAGWPAVEHRIARFGGSKVLVAVDGAIAGALLLDDPLRPDAARTVRALKRAGFAEIAMLTGDQPLIADSVGAALGVDRVYAQQTPEDKVAAVAASSAARPTVMVGDGINDAPALATADVGVAMGARGATSSSEAADVVLVADRLDRLVEAVRVSRRSRRVALQSVLLGMGLSFVAMGFAAFGWLPPVAGAVLQEGIDALAILSALRALGGDGVTPGRPVIDAALARRLRDEHRELYPRIEHVRAVADALGDLAPAEAARELRALADDLHATLLPHERSDEQELYPELVDGLPGDDPLAAMSRTHQEIFSLARVFDSLVAHLAPDGPAPGTVPDLRRVLYGLHAVLRLHFAQEEELFHALSEDYTPTVLTGVAT